jgi:hypothetical protein
MPEFEGKAILCREHGGCECFDKKIEARIKQ